MEKIFLFLLYIVLYVVLVVFSVSAVVRLVSKPNTDLPKIDIPNQHTTEHTNIVVEKIIDVPAICQYPDFPTGCEATAAVITLRYWGEKITIGEFIDNFLPIDHSFYRKGCTLHGPDPYQGFVGDPRTTSSYGCFSPVIQSALVNYLGSSERIFNSSGMSLIQLCDQFINNDIPVLLWASSDMTRIRKGQTWTLPSGESFTWPSGEHCLVLIGYNDSDYFFCDPKYSTPVAYPRNIVESRYAEMSQQSLVILPR